MGIKIFYFTSLPHSSYGFYKFFFFALSLSHSSLPLLTSPRYLRSIVWSYGAGKAARNPTALFSRAANSRELHPLEIFHLSFRPPPCPTGLYTLSAVFRKILFVSRSFFFVYKLHKNFGKARARPSTNMWLWIGRNVEISAGRAFLNIFRLIHRFAREMMYFKKRSTMKRTKTFRCYFVTLNRCVVVNVINMQPVGVYYYETNFKLITKVTVPVRNYYQNFYQKLDQNGCSEISPGILVLGLAIYEFSIILKSLECDMKPFYKNIENC